MSEDVNVITMPNIEDVYQVYSGKVGCMCGCRGKYKVQSKHRKFADENRGYPHDDEDVSDRSVKIIHTKLTKAIKSGEKVTTMYKPDKDGTNYIYIENGERCLALYFKTDSGCTKSE